jgi:hypothetical protein
MEYSNRVIEDLMEKFKPVVGDDYPGYKNHVKLLLAIIIAT